MFYNGLSTLDRKKKGSVPFILETLDKGMLELVTKHHADSFELITSIPGVGAKTAIMMICLRKRGRYPLMG